MDVIVLAVVAAKKIAQIKIDKGIEDKEFTDFAASNEDAIFYSNKIKTTRHFVDGIIPQFDALLAGGKKQNYDALEISF